jgi:hypothetical protein
MPVSCVWWFFSQLDQEISQLIQSSEQQSGKKFLVCGLTFDDFVQQQNNDYIAEKENEKALRVILSIISIPNIRSYCSEI